jgi:hypothetical protein
MTAGGILSIGLAIGLAAAAAIILIGLALLIVRFIWLVVMGMVASKR